MPLRLHEERCARIRYQWQGQIITSDRYCAMWFLVPALDIFFWHHALISNPRKHWRLAKSRLPHDDVIKWKHFPRYWPFLRGIHRSPVNSPHKGQWDGALMFSLICAWINRWVNNHEAVDLRRYRTHYDVTVISVGGELETINEQRNIEEGMAIFVVPVSMLPGVYNVSQYIN